LGLPPWMVWIKAAIFKLVTNLPLFFFAVNPYPPSLIIHSL